MITVVGAGPIGLLSSILLARSGFNVVVYEEDSRVGYPEHCAGVISRRCYKLYTRVISNQDLILTRLKGVRVVLRDEVYEFKSSITKAYVVNRPLLDYKLYLKSLDYNVDINLSRRIYKPYYNLIDRANPRYLIVASGAKQLLLDSASSVLPAIQVDIKASDEIIPGEVVEIGLVKEINDMYFTWVIPLGNSIYRVGTAYRYNPYKRLLSYIGWRGFKGRIIRRYSGLIVDGGPRRKFINGRIIYVGDAAGQNKVTTGGGLYYGASASILLAKAIQNDNVRVYEVEWRRMFDREIKLQKVLRRIFLSINDGTLKNIFTILDKIEFFNILLHLGDMDYHSTSIIKLIMDAGILSYLRGTSCRL